LAERSNLPSSPQVRIALLVSSLLILAAPAAGFALAADSLSGLWLGLSAVPSGRYLVLSQGLGPGVDVPIPLLISLAVCSEAGLAGLTSVASESVLFRAPLVGGWLRRLRTRLSRRHGRAPSAAFIYLFIFIVTPIPGSGGIGGAILGRILGLDVRVIMVAAALGTAVSAAALAFGVVGLDALLEPLEDRRLVVGVRTGVIVVLLGLLAWLGSRMGGARTADDTSRG
jgi:uncharacterized membrane protein